MSEPQKVTQWFHEAAGLFQPLVCRRDPGHVAAAAPLLYPPPDPGLPADMLLLPGQSPSSLGSVRVRGLGFRDTTLLLPSPCCDSH